MIGSWARSMPNTAIICGTHSCSIFARSAWNGAASGPLHDPRSRLRRRCVRPLGRRQDQRLDQLMAKPRDTIDTHITADHALGQTRLKRLIDDASAPAEIG